QREQAPLSGAAHERAVRVPTEVLPRVIAIDSKTLVQADDRVSFERLWDEGGQPPPKRRRALAVVDDDARVVADRRSHHEAAGGRDRRLGKAVPFGGVNPLLAFRLR